MAAGFSLGGLLGGGDDLDIYGDLLTDKQKAALRSREMTQGLLRMSGAFAEAAKPSLLPTGGIGSALGKGAAALAGGEDEGLKSLATIQKIKQTRQQMEWADRIKPIVWRELSGATVIAPANQPPSPGAQPVAPVSAAPPGAPPPGAGDLSPATGQVPPPLTGADIGYDADLGGPPPSPPRAPPGTEMTGLLSLPPGPPDQVIPPPLFGGPLALPASYGGGATPGMPPFRRAAASPGAAGAAGSAGGSPFLDLAEQYESGGRNIHQQIVSPEKSSAQGYYQITTPTWRDTAPKAGVDLRQFPTAMTAPKEVQRAVAEQLYRERGAQPWSSNKALMAATGYAGASLRGEKPGDIVLPSGSGGGPQLEALQALMQLTRPPGGDDDDDIGGGLPVRLASAGAAPDDAAWLRQNAPFPTQGGPARARSGWDQGFTYDQPKVPFGEDPGDFLPGRGASAAAGPADTVIPPARTAGRSLPITRAQYSPGGGAPGTTPDGGTIPGSTMTPRQMGALGAAMELAGMDSGPIRMLLDSYYKSPEYLATAKRATEEVEREFAGPKAAAAAAATQKYIQENETHKSGLDLARDLIGKGVYFDKTTGTMKPITNAAEALSAIDNAKEQFKADRELVTTTLQIPGEKQPRKLQMTRSQAVAVAQGKPVPELGIPAMTVIQMGEPVLSPEETAAQTQRGKTGQEITTVQVWTPSGLVSQPMTNLEAAARRKLSSERGPGGPPQIGDIVDAPALTEPEKKIAGALGEDFVTLRRQAQAASSTISSTHDLRAKLDSGIFTGLDANWSLFAAKLGETLGWTGLSNPEKVKNTEIYISGIGKEVLAMVKELRPASNVDLQFAERMAGGANMSAGAIRELLDMRERYARLAIERHNEEARGMNPGAFTGFRREIPMPSPYQQKSGTTPGGLRWKE